ncbi:MAG TPA: hypothetical protein VFZ89_01840, partial [Solirubrobacteraceae bacterium]
MRAAQIVARWVRLYTRRLPVPVAERRVAELDADLHDHIVHERAQGTSERRIAASVLSRMLRGLPADAVWRVEHARPKTTYRSALVLAILTPLMLFWLIGAVGVIGTEGDRADMMYLGVFGVWILGALVARLRPAGMARALTATALAQGLVTAIAIVAGKHENPVTSVPELVGLN